MQEIAVDRVFIGSCTNARIEDLRAAAKLVRGYHVATTVKAMVVPGSQSVKAQAEREGLDMVFKTAGFDWREPGCSMCLGMNPDILAPGERCASTSNRNFEGRQGRGVTHAPGSPGDGGRGGDHRPSDGCAHVGIQGGASSYAAHQCADFSTAAPLDISNIDTDQIIPKQFLKSIERTGYGEFLFFDWRRVQDGPHAGEPNPDFALNQPQLCRREDPDCGQELWLRKLARTRGMGAD